MALRPGPAAPGPSEPGVLRIQVRGLAGRFREWETLGALAAMAREQGFEVEVVWLRERRGEER